MDNRPSRRRLRSPMTAFTVALALALALPASALGEHSAPPSSYVTLTVSGEVIPLINSGDVHDGVTFQGIPDGIGVMPVGDGTQYVDLFVAHEESHVPFPISANFAGGPTIVGSADMQDSSVSRVRVNLATQEVTELEVALLPSLGFIRFCSSFMAGPDQGFSRYTYFANEESNDVVPVPAGAPYGADPALSPDRQAGYTVMLDPLSGAVSTLARAGRLNHENLVFVPGGWKGFAALTGDDTFTAPGSQMYLYTANNEKQVQTDKGQLWAFQVTAANGEAVDPYDPQNHANDYLDIGTNESFSGRFIHVPSDVARGVTDGAPQTALEDWSNANNVFQFVRIEDVAYDPDSPRTVYFTDTGTTRLAEDASGRLTRLTTGGTNSNGRVFKMVMNARDPRVVDSLTILVDGLQLPTPMRNPDNLEVGHDSIMVQEDTSNAKIWQYALDVPGAAWTHVATVTHPTAPSAGESSGIVDMSEWMESGWWALDVQSHVARFTDQTTYYWPDGQDVGSEPDPYLKRLEDGQLLLIHIPGS